MLQQQHVDNLSNQQFDIAGGFFILLLLMQHPAGLLPHSKNRKVSVRHIGE